MDAISALGFVAFTAVGKEHPVAADSLHSASVARDWVSADIMIRLETDDCMLAKNPLQDMHVLIRNEE